MTDHPHRERPTLPDAGTPASDTTIDERRDAHGFDPAEFEWRPVPRRPRADGWTPEVQRAFIEALGRTGLVEHACLEVDRSVKSAYALRNAPGGEGFARAWTAACRASADRLLDICFTRSIEGEEIPVYDADGIRTGVQHRFNTRLAMFLLRAYKPELFGHLDADGRGRRGASPGPSAALPMPQAVAALGPVTPADPHLLVAPDLLADQIAAARREGTEPLGRVEGYSPTLVPAPHPRVVERAERNQARRRAREDY